MAETKTKAKSKQEEPSLDEQIQLLDVKPAVDRVLKHPESGEERTYVQHELGFLPKLKLFRLLSGTIRLATEGESTGGVRDFVEEAFVQGGDARPESYMETLLRLIELAPDTVDELYILILKVPLEEQEWVREALEELDDETGIDILDTFIAQNGKALRAFFTKHLAKLQKRATAEFGNLDTEQELETTAS